MFSGFLGGLLALVVILLLAMGVTKLIEFIEDMYFGRGPGT